MEEELIKRKKLFKLMRKTEERKMKLVVDVNENEFEREVVEKSKRIPIVVDFWASWCMPCLVLSPILEKLAKEYKGKFILVKINVDRNRRLAQKYGIMSIPCVKMFKNGKIVDEFVGAMPENMIRKWLEKNLG